MNMQISFIFIGRWTSFWWIILVFIKTIQTPPIRVIQINLTFKSPRWDFIRNWRDFFLKKSKLIELDRWNVDFDLAWGIFRRKCGPNVRDACLVRLTRARDRRTKLEKAGRFNCPPVPPFDTNTIQLYFCFCSMKLTVESHRGDLRCSGEQRNVRPPPSCVMAVVQLLVSLFQWMLFNLFKDWPSFNFNWN